MSTVRLMRFDRWIAFPSLAYLAGALAVIGGVWLRGRFETLPLVDGVFDALGGFVLGGGVISILGGVLVLGFVTFERRSLRW